MASDKDDSERLTLIQTLAEAASKQTKIANHRWLALITVAAFALLQQPSNNQTITIPFGLGVVAPNQFFGVIFFMLVVITIAFAAAHAQSFVAQNLAHKTIDTMTRPYDNVYGIRARDIYDVLREAGLTQVFPLSRLLSTSPLRLVNWIGIFVYVVMKVVSLLIFYGLPTYALWLVYGRLEQTGRIRTLLTLVGLVAAVALTVIIVADVAGSFKVVKKAIPDREGEKDKR